MAGGINSFFQLLYLRDVIKMACLYGQSALDRLVPAPARTLSRPGFPVLGTGESQIKRHFSIFRIF